MTTSPARCTLLLVVFAIVTAGVVSDSPLSTDALRSNASLTVTTKSHASFMEALSTYSAPAYDVKEMRGGKINMISLQFAITSGILLAFNSGYINGCCLKGTLLNTKQAVAAVTGAYTTSALGLASGNTDQFRTQLTVLASYIGGSTIAGILNPIPVPFQMSSSNGLAFLVASALLWSSSSLAQKGSANILVFCLAAIANGIQNSVTSAHTSNLIRTAHFSGISSDIGTFLGQVLRGNRQNLHKLKIFLALAVSFWSGGFLSFFVSNRLGATCLVPSAVLYTTIGLGLILFS